MLTKPIILKQPAFDATKEQLIRFNTIGGDQVVRNRLKIITNDGVETEVYNEEQVTYNFLHSIMGDSLENGKYYKMLLKTYHTQDPDEVGSVWSDPVAFRCYTEPTLFFYGFPADNIIRNSSYVFDLVYEQLEGERLKSYKIEIFDTSDVLVDTSGVVFANGQNRFSYNVVGFGDNSKYKVQATGITINDTIVKSDVKKFTVDYVNPELFARLQLENDCNNGWINITSNIITIEGESNPTPPIYLNDKEVDVTNPNTYVRWTSGYVINGDFTAEIHSRDNNLYKELALFTGDGVINFRLIENEDRSKVFAELKATDTHNAPSCYVYSGAILTPTNLEQLCIIIRRVNNVYTIVLENRGSNYANIFRV